MARNPRCRDSQRGRTGIGAREADRGLHGGARQAVGQPGEVKGSHDMPTFFIVRATIADPARRAAFDAWYKNEHLPDAARSFGAEKAWRFWSETDPAVHQATYQFADRAALDRGTRPENMTRLVADFDRAWPQIKRSREIMTLAQEWGA